ncbi:MAG: hypothetical protein KAW12_12290 [Candidatus Aminicenantes bacterium]|nr:hypothetical protein [Candidatus Aminicenantes bacterium]
MAPDDIQEQIKKELEEHRKSIEDLTSTVTGLTEKVKNCVEKTESLKTKKKISTFVFCVIAAAFLFFVIFAFFFICKTPPPAESFHTFLFFVFGGCTAVAITVIICGYKLIAKLWSDGE